MTDIVISAQQLTKRYGAVTVVDAIDLTVRKGETFGVLGPNGSGKTTTILMMLGLTARENLAYTAKLMGIGAAERSQRIVGALARVRLEEVIDRRVGTFSRGMRQRLGLAEIIMKQAEIAILDEPTSGLDPQSTLEFLDLIRQLQREGVTVLLSSHQLDQVQRVCDRVALFQTGRIVLMGAVGELARNILGAGFVVEVEAEGAGLDRRFAAMSGVSAVETLASGRYRLTADRDVRPEAARAVVAANGALTHLSVHEPSLEAIYTRYFQSGALSKEGVSDAA